MATSLNKLTSLMCFWHPLERCFILNGKIDLWFITSYQKPFVVSVACVCFQIFTARLTSWPKMSLTCSISLVNRNFGNFLLKNVLFCSSILNYWCSITILWKFQIFWTSGACGQLASKLPTLLSFVYFAFMMGKKWKYLIFLKPMHRIRLFVHGYLRQMVLH